MRPTSQFRGISDQKFELDVEPGTNSTQKLDFTSYSQWHLLLLIQIPSHLLQPCEPPQHHPLQVCDMERVNNTQAKARYIQYNSLTLLKDQAVYFQTFLQKTNLLSTLFQYTMETWRWKYICILQTYSLLLNKVYYLFEKFKIGWYTLFLIWKQMVYSILVAFTGLLLLWIYYYSSFISTIKISFNK